MATAVAGRHTCCRIIPRIVPSFSVAKIQRPRRQSQALASALRSFSASSRVPAKKFTVDHEWVELSEDGTTGTIGVSEYAAKALGSVVFVELPTVDQEVGKGDSISSVESVKSASDVMTPISGTVVEANHTLDDAPATINKSPEGDGWIAKIKVTDASEIEELMDVGAYKKFTEEVESK